MRAFQFLIVFIVGMLFGAWYVLFVVLDETWIIPQPEQYKNTTYSI